MNFAGTTNINQMMDTSDIDEMLMRGEIDLQQAQVMKAQRLEQQRTGKSSTGVDISKYAGKYEPVKIRSLATTEERNKAKTEGAAKKRSWAVRGIMGAYQSGDLTDPEEIMQAAIEAHVNDDPQIFDLYAAAKQKANPEAGTQDWLPNKDALSEGIDMYMQTPQGQSDQFARILKRAASGELSKEQFGQMLTQNPQAFADFQGRFSRFTSGGIGRPASPAGISGEQERLTGMAQQMRGDTEPRADFTALSAAPEGAAMAKLGEEAKIGTPSRMVSDLGEPSPLPVPDKYAGYDKLKEQAAAARTPQDTEQARIRSLEARRARIMSDATLFNSKVGRKELDDVNAELTQYGRKIYSPLKTGNANADVRNKLGLMGQENKLRAEIKSDPYIKNFSSVDWFYNVARTAMDHAKAGDPQFADQVLINAFNKFTDPTSVVMPAEFARTPEGQSIWQRFIGFAEKNIKGGVGLSDATRQDLFNIMGEMYNSALKVYQNRTNQLREAYKSYEDLGIDLDRVFLGAVSDTKKELEAPAPAGGTAGTTGATGMQPSQYQSPMDFVPPTKPQPSNIRPVPTKPAVRSSIKPPMSAADRFKQFKKSKGQ